MMPTCYVWLLLFSMHLQFNPGRRIRIFTQL